MIFSKNAEIIAVGTELLLGQIANTNAAWLSEQLADQGISVYYHAAVGDNMERVKNVFNEAQSRSDIVFVTGGLGPTDDDMTREAFSQMSGIAMAEDEATVRKLELFFEKQQTEMTRNNLKQAQVFKTAQVLSNSEGTAPGMIVEHEGTLWVFLPGVPREMKSLAEEHVFPYLAGLFAEKSIIKSEVLKFRGIGESKLEDELKEIIRSQTNPTIAPLVAEDSVIIRLTAKAETSEAAAQLIRIKKEEILKVVGVYFCGSDQVPLPEAVYQKLKEKKLTISAAESLTGGMFTDALISIPGASAVCYGGIVSYDRSVKESVLGVPREIIEQHGTVSEACAKEMAVRVRALLGTDIGISFTGAAGPEAAEGKPAGTVFIGISTENNCTALQIQLAGDRQSVRRQSVMRGLEQLQTVLENS